MHFICTWTYLHICMHLSGIVIFPFYLHYTYTLHTLCNQLTPLYNQLIILQTTSSNLKLVPKYSVLASSSDEVSFWSDWSICFSAFCFHWPLTIDIVVFHYLSLILCSFVITMSLEIMSFYVGGFLLEEELFPEDNRRSDKRTPRITLRRYSKSPFLYLFQSGNNQALLNCCGVDHKVFHELLELFAPVFNHHLVQLQRVCQHELNVYPC